MAVRPSPSLSTVMRAAASSSVTAGDAAASASARPLRRSRSVLWRASAASWWRSRDQASAKNASSQSWRNCRSQARILGGSASSRSLNRSCCGPRAAARSRARRRISASDSASGPCEQYGSAHVNSRAASTNCSSVSLSSRSSSSASVPHGSALRPGMPANGMNRSENVVRHRKSASHIRSARCGSSRARTPVTQPCRPGWWAGSDSACSAMPSSARGDGTTATLSGRSPAMSMCTLMPSWCTRPLTTPPSIDGRRQSTRRRPRPVRTVDPPGQPRSLRTSSLTPSRRGDPP